MNHSEYENQTYLEECIIAPSSITDFPSILFSKTQLRNGAVILNIICAAYFFICIAFICDKYFLPTIDRICKILNISQDVAATTFMATATTMPEFFTNSVSTFIAESDMGLSAIVGSTLFNTLGVAACASLFATKPIQIDWWPLTRDALLFSINIAVLVSIAWDGVIMWWETCILVSLYLLYWIVMFQNKKIMKHTKRFIEDHLMWCQRIKNFDIENQRPKVVPSNNSLQMDDIKDSSHNIINNNNNIGSTNSNSEINKNDQVNAIEGIWKITEDSSKIYRLWFIFTWPIRFSLYYTIPNPLKHKKFFPISFVMCTIWIGCSSYMIFWMVVIIGDTIYIPESVMGISFLAIGGCMPETISAVIIIRNKSGEMGVSNALGANCLAILFSLGVPWFIKTMTYGAGWTGAHIVIYSYGMEYTIMILILAVITLYSIVAFNGYKLQRRIGIYLLCSYAIFITFSILMEYNVFLVGAPSEC